MLWNSVRPGQEDFRRKRIIRDLKKHRRCYIAHAPGSGKTILSNMIRHELGANRTVYFCPTRALVFQTYRAYAAHCAEHALAFRGLAVVSASPPAEYPFLIERDCGHPYRQASGGTGEIIRFLSEARESADPSIIFATYHGRRKIVDALAEVNMCVDLKIMDEAHHLTGSIGKAWQELLSDETLRATYRLAMTGTPRFVGDPHRASVLIGLDTAELFGVCSSTFSIRDAIEAKVIVPYQFYLAVMTRREEHELKQLVEEANAEVRNSADRIRYKDALAAATAIKAIKYKGLKKGFTFHSRIHRAAEFTSIVRRLAEKKKLSKNVFIDMVSSGSTNDHKERVHEAIRRSRKAIIANVNMFGEGFDETSIDFVVYVDPRNSRVNIVQSALRAMRLHEGKTHGAVILPITIHPRENDVELILQSDYWRIGQAILAFATFDEAMNDWATGTRGGYQTVERMPEFPSGLPMQIIGMPKALAAVEDQLLKSVHLHVRDTVYFRGALEREALRRTRDVAEYRRKYGEYPPAHGRNAGPNGTWLDRMRRARAGIGGTGVFYQSCQDLAVELGYPDMFEQPRTKAKCEEYALKRTAEVADYYYEHGEYPVSAGENASEPGEWLAGMRWARRRHKKGVKKSIGRTWYPSCEARAKDLGCPDMFDDPLPRQEFALMRTRQCIEYFNEHGKYPAASKRNRNAVGAWLKQKRTTVKEKGGWTDYRACQKLAEQLGHPNLFGSGSRNIQSSHGPIEQREVRSVA